MATIVTPTDTEQAQNLNQGFTMDGLTSFFSNPIFLFVLLIILILIVIVIFWMARQKKEDAFKERDDVNYAVYKRSLRDCLHNAYQKWINRTYSLANILVLGIPLFWKEHSLRVIDINDTLLGYYRGHKVTEKGETIYCLYKTKRFFILENLFLLRCMDTWTYENKIEEENPKTKKKEIKLTTEVRTFENFYEWLPKNVNKSLYSALKIQCDGISEDAYFHIPNYLRKSGDKGLIAMDLRPEFRFNTKEYTMNEQYWRSITDLSRNIDESARSNPAIAQGRYKAEKTEEEKRIDDQTPNQNKGL